MVEDYARRARMHAVRMLVATSSPATTTSSSCAASASAASTAASSSASAAAADAPNAADRGLGDGRVRHDPLAIVLQVGQHRHQPVGLDGGSADGVPLMSPRQGNT